MTTWTLADWEQGNVPLSLTAAQTAQVLGISQSQVYQEIKDGRIPRVMNMDPIRVPAVWVRRTLIDGPSTSQ